SFHSRWKAFHGRCPKSSSHRAQNSDAVRTTIETTYQVANDFWTSGSFSGTGFSGTTSSSSCGDGATPRPGGAKPRLHTHLHVEPGRDPHVFDMKQKPQQHLDRQGEHG